MQLTREEQQLLEAEISRISHIENKEQQTVEFNKFFHNSFLWHKAVDDVWNSYICEVKAI